MFKVIIFIILDIRYGCKMIFSEIMSDPPKLGKYCMTCPIDTATCILVVFKLLNYLKFYFVSICLFVQSLLRVYTGIYCKDYTEYLPTEWL